ncbi:MAG: FadR/GntR family transcriptional regulator [Gammaproteobacteria bacterium]
MAREQRRYRDIVERITQLIDTEEFPAGGRLPPERELADRFEVSRPTVREAIIALEASGRVQVKKGSGIYVTENMAAANGFDMTVGAFELTEARALIEGEAAALAATLISEEELQHLEIALEEMAKESNNGALISEIADKKFHHIISRATRNDMIASVIDKLWYIRDNSPTVHHAYQAICETDAMARVNEHKEILVALKKRDAEASRAAMHRHFSRILDKLITVNETQQMEKIKRNTTESRERFSLNHLSQ